jgi:hypothetical protein
VLRDVHAYLSSLENDAATTVFAADRLDDLAGDPRYRIAATERRRTSASPPPAVDADEIEAPLPGVPYPPDFGASSSATTFPPPLSQDDRALLRSLEGPVDDADAADVPVTTEAAWSKVLSGTDAQHPPQPDSNPTGNLRLSQARNPIDHRTWFRYELFADAAWITGTDTNDNPLETATVPMRVTIARADLGWIDLRVDHAPHRESDQGNVPTILHWGSTLLPVLRASDQSGATVTIARGTDGAFALSIG